MSDSIVTIVGNAASEPSHSVTVSGAHVANLRMASTTRRFDRASGEWCDGSTVFVTVSCWRSLAQNVAASVHKGDALVVTGRLRTRSYTGRDEQRRVSTEIEATALGHDLTRGVAQFARTRTAATEQVRDVRATSAGERATSADEGDARGEVVPAA